MKNKEKIKLIMLVLVLPITLLSIISTYAVTEFLGSETSYDNTVSELNSANVDAAIDELYRKITNRPVTCPEGYECSDLPSVTFNANTGTFDNNSSTNTIYYDIKDTTTTETVTKYSHTSNVDDTGKKNSSYGNNWTNANITGTDRGDTSKAHVITIEGASSLNVEIYYNGESTNYDWACVWAGSYPSYTAASNCTSTGYVSGKLGGSQSGSYTVNGNYLTSMGKSTYTIEGDTVTFGFRTDGSGVGQGYGYYAIVTGEATVSSKEVTKNYGTYKESTKSGGYNFIGWNTASDGSGTTYKTEEQINNIVEENSNITLYAIYKGPKCVAATTLHTASCSSSYSSEGCQDAGYSSGDEITYGQLPSGDTYQSGDAFDCDVNGDGTYDSERERFYYVSDYYDTSTKTTNSDVAVLIYYSNVSGGTTIDNTSAYSYYGNYSENSYTTNGPQKDSGYAYYQLPSTTQWSNISLYKSTRAILNEKGESTVIVYYPSTTGNLPNAYDYGDKAARFLTAQEINSACNTWVGSNPTGHLDTCKYLMENTSYDNSSYLSGYWLETPSSSSRNYMFFVFGPFRDAVSGYSYGEGRNGTRPVIEILKSDISR